MGDQTQAYDIFQTPLSSGYPLPLSIAKKILVVAVPPRWPPFLPPQLPPSPSHLLGAITDAVAIAPSIAIAINTIAAPPKFVKVAAANPPRAGISPVATLSQGCTYRRRPPHPHRRHHPQPNVTLFKDRYRRRSPPHITALSPSFPPSPPFQ